MIHKLSHTEEQKELKKNTLKNAKRVNVFISFFSFQLSLGSKCLQLCFCPDAGQRLNRETISIDPRELQENMRRIVHIMFIKKYSQMKQMKIDSKKKEKRKLIPRKCR